MRLGSVHSSDSTSTLRSFLQTQRGEIVAAWKSGIERLPASAVSLTVDGLGVIAWLSASVEAQLGSEEPIEAMPSGVSFSGARAIAELALLVATIERLRPISRDDELASLHRIIDAAIAHSLARDVEESERLRTRLALASDVTHFGSWDLDPISGAVSCDARCRELFGVDAGEPTTVVELMSGIHDVDRARVQAHLATTLGAGESYLDECRTLRVDEGGCRWIALAASTHPGVDVRTPRVLGIVHDITDRKRREEEHARVLEELSRAVVMSEMFVGILSHDLRNPLSAILGAAELLRHDAADAKAARILSIVVSSGERMGRMIDQLLDFTRARLGEGIPLDRSDDVDLAALAGDVVAEARSASGGAVLRLTTQGQTLGDWDRDRLSQILSNLVGNAVQHGVPAGSIDVDVDGRDPVRVVLAVRNEGVIPAHLVPVIFNPFRGTVHTRGKSRGLGLGLYVARQIALAHGGELELETSSAGTTFQLGLPRRARAATPSTPGIVREEELAAFQGMAAPPSAGAVTAQLFGAVALHERSPREYADVVARYGTLLDQALTRTAFRTDGEALPTSVRALAERLGDLGAGPREVTDVHARALAHAVRGVTAAKAQALLSEGRLLALELMGNLTSYYRRRARGAAGTGPPGGLT